jgi:hypothetical protein
VVGNGGGVELHLANLLLGAGVILALRGVREKKLRYPLLALALQGHCHDGADEYTLFPILGYYERSLLDAEAPAQSDRDNNDPPLPNPARALGHPGLLCLFDCLNV